MILCKSGALPLTRHGGPVSRVLMGAQERRGAVTAVRLIHRFAAVVTSVRFCRTCSSRRGSMNLVFLMLLSLSTSLGHSLQASEVDDSALAFVEDRHLGESLGWLGYQVASRTPTFGSIVEAVGKTEAQTLVKDELQHLQPQFQAQWDRNLAAAYAQSFSAEELRALNRGDDQPMLANKLRAKQNDVGMDMKARSAELLRDFVSQALNNAQARVPH